MNISDVIRGRAHDLGDRPALIEGDLSVDWASLWSMVEAASWHLRETGVRAGDVVLVGVRSGIEYVVLTGAIQRLGAAACGTEWRSRAAELASLVQQVSPRLRVTDRTSAKPAAVTEAVTSDDWWRLPIGKAPPPAVDAPDGPASLILTSGTTGQPKGMSISHAAALGRGLMRAHDLGLRRGMKVLHVLPMPTSAAAGGLMGQFLAGSVTIFQPLLSRPEDLLEALQSQAIEHVALVPTMVRGLLNLPPRRGMMLPALEAMVSLGSAFQPEEKREALARLTPNIFEHYGSTGTGPIARALPADLLDESGSVGRPHSFVHIEIVDEEHRPLPPGQVGRVRVRSPGNAAGYAGMSGSEERNEIFLDGFVYPGDLGRLDGQGRLFLEGRAASLIIRGGRNIHPEEVERVLLAYPAVSEAAVAARPDAQLGEVPVALVVTRAPVRTAELMAHCRANLQPFKVPVEIRNVESLPRTSSGKIRRADLAVLVSG